MSVQERVVRGTRWLDHVRPGWRDSLELGTLDLSNGGQCVLGQVFSEEAAAYAGRKVCGYSYVLTAVLTPAEWLDCPDWPSAHGFERDQSFIVCPHLQEALEGSGSTAVEDELAALEAEWRRMIHVPRDGCASLALSR
jgi:hypothetical protein